MAKNEINEVLNLGPPPPLMTKGNHFVYSYAGQPWASATHLTDKYSIRFGKVSRVPLDFRSECIIAAREISLVAKKKLTVCLSGGLDSELVALSCFHARIPFSCVIMRFEDDLNIHDIEWAIKFCDAFKIPYQFFDLNFSRFSSSSEFLRIATEARCLAPLVVAQIKLFSDLCKAGEVPISGSSEIIFKRTQALGWGLFHQELIGSMFRFQRQNQLSCQAGFFYWSPELLASFFLDPWLQSEVFNNVDCRFYSTSEVKHQFYSMHFQVADRPKYRGYEKMIELNDYLKAVLAEKIPMTDELFIPMKVIREMILG
jgi:hypothetical protein